MQVLKIENFSKKYGDFEAVTELSLSVEKGEIVGFVGKNGAGKSTTLRSMLDIIRCSSGKISILGLDSHIDNKNIKSMVSYVPSEAIFYDNITCEKLLNFAMQFTTTTKEELTELANYFELDLSRKINELSLGNRKKVSLIQGFIKNSQLLLLDEPTNGLDPLMQSKFFNLILKEKARGKTIFLSSHNLSEIEKYCDKVAIIKDGMLVDYFDIADIKQRHKQVVTYTLKGGETVSFELNEDINQLIEKLSKLDLVSLEIGTNTMEDEFFGYYENSDEVKSK